MARFLVERFAFRRKVSHLGTFAMMAAPRLPLFIGMVEHTFVQAMWQKGGPMGVYGSSIASRRHSRLLKASLCAPSGWSYSTKRHAQRSRRCFSLGTGRAAASG